MKRLSAVARFLVPTLILLLSGCSLFGGGKDEPAYKSADSTALLELPPDLSPPQADDAYLLPEDRSVSARALGAQGAVAGGHKAPPPEQEVLPDFRDMKLERDGGVLWLRVKATPEQLWGRIRQFIEAQGLRIRRQEPRKGVIETHWAERRLGVEEGGIRGMFEKGTGFLGAIKDSGLRDKFIFRLHDDGDGYTAIFVTHRGAEEVPQESTTVWQSRPSDPALEAEMLTDLMLFLGDRKNGATVKAEGKAAAEAIQAVPPATLADYDGGPALRVQGDFDSVWRRLGVFLDRSGLVVDDEDRAKGIYYVTFLGKEKDQGFFSRLFGKSGPLTFEEQYQVHVQRGDNGAIYITLHDKEGRRLTSDKSREALDIIREQF